MPIRIVLTMLIFIFVSGVARSETPGSYNKPEEQKGYSLKDIVVTETKIPQSEENVTQQIDVISEEEIQYRTYADRNLSEIFLYEPGIFVNPLSRNDANWGSFGGLGPKYNVYLLDGLPIDSFVDPMSLDPWILQRAEVFKGPASIMYSNYLSSDFAGNETPLAGITNLVTKEKIDAPLTMMQAGYGSYNTYGGKIYNQGSTGNFHYFIGGTYESSDYTNYGTQNSWLNMIDDPEYKKWKLYLKGTYFFDRDDNKLSLFANVTQHTGDAGRPNRDYWNYYDTVNLNYSNQINDWLNMQLAAGYRYYNRQWDEDNFPTNLGLREKDSVKQQIIPATLTFNIKHWGNSLLTLGADYQYATYETFAETNGVETKQNNAPTQSIGVYIQEKYIVDNWVFRAGGRFNSQKNNFDLLGGTVPEVSDKTYNKFLWSAGIRFNATNQLSLFTNAGSSFLAPSGKSVGGTLNSSDFGVPGKNGQLPNPNLDSEKGIAFDLGLDYQISKNILTTVRGFINKVDNAIVENVVSQNPSQSMSVNAGDTTAYGVEAQIKQYLNEYVQWFANFTFTQTKVNNDIDHDQDGSNIPFTPNWMANVGAVFTPFKSIVIAPYFQYVGIYYDSTSLSGRLKFGNYGVVNMHMQGDITKNIRLNLDLNNITNNKYEMPWQFQNPGFSAFGSIQVSL